MARAEGLTLVAIVAALVFAESVLLLDFVAPGELGLVVAGAAAASNGTPLWMIIVAAACGAVLGDIVGFLLGGKVGTDGLQRWRLTRWVASDVDDAKRVLDRRGGPAVAIARWVGALRAVVPFVAGSSKLSLRRMLLWSIPSAIAWAAAVSSLGYFFGRRVASFVDRLGLIVSGLVIAALIVVWRLHRRRRRRYGDGDLEAPRCDSTRTAPTGTR